MLCELFDFIMFVARAVALTELANEPSHTVWGSSIEDTRQEQPRPTKIKQKKKEK